MSDIDRGELSSGTRLPTQRELADVLGVALGTVTKAYAEAERRGLIHSEGRRGTFVGGVPSRKSALSALMDTDRHVIDLSKNHPTYRLDPDLGEALRRLSRRPGYQGLLEYGPSTGFPHHRAAGARWFAELGLEVEPENVVVTAGAQHALTVALAAVVGPGEVVLSDEYTYPGLKAAAELVGVELIGVPMDAEGPVLESIRSICRQRRVRAMYLNPTLQNPAGYIMPESRRYDIAGLAERFDFVIIEDELLRPFVPDPPSFVSSFHPDRSLALLSASKVIAAGLRVGFVAAPSAYIARLTDALRSTVLSPPPLTSEILTRWLADGTVTNIIARRREEFEARLKLAREVFRGFDIRVTPNSTHVWLILPEPWSTTEFAIQVNRRGVAVAPAEIFAVNSRQSSVNAVRISLGTAPDRETLTRGLETVAATLSSTPFQGATVI